MNSESGADRGLLRVMILGTASACGAMAASLEALRARAAGFYFQITWRTGVAFVIGTALILWIWRIMLDESDTPRQRFARQLAKTFLFASAAAAFLYPLRFVPKSQMPDIAIGLGLAIFVLSIIGFLVWKTRRFLETDEQENETK
ncbi:MAG TPA: hypothetical protein VH619_07710 [Verrucomicrobiae bacterium]|jgi:protein-S-isoprenylcysteine O-methyltransferase Ste14|nr:hypothetical protein [Verrucomicrobiae bacterium]